MKDTEENEAVNVVHFVYKLESYSGAAKQGINLAKHMPSSVRSSVINFQSKGSYSSGSEGAVKIHNLPAGRVLRLFWLIYYFAKEPFFIAHLHGYFTIPLILAKLFSKKVYLKSTLYGDDDFDSLLVKKFGRFRMMLAKSVAMNNALTGKIFETNMRYIPESRIVRIPNGVELSPIDQNKVKSPLFIFVGAVVPRKRPDLAIQYFISNYARIEGSQLLLIGPKDTGNPEMDVSYVEYCEEIAGTAGDKIRFLGNISKHELNEIYSNSIGLFLFSTAEGMPNVVLEAMSNNCVPIVSQMDGVASEMIENGVSGFILATEHEILSLEQLNTIARSGNVRARIESDFSIESVVSRTLRVYDQLRLQK